MFKQAHGQASSWSSFSVFLLCELRLSSSVSFLASVVPRPFCVSGFCSLALCLPLPVFVSLSLCFFVSLVRHSGVLLQTHTHLPLARDCSWAAKATWNVDVQSDAFWPVMMRRKGARWQDLCTCALGTGSQGCHSLLTGPWCGGKKGDSTFHSREIEHSFSLERSSTHTCRPQARH